MEPYDMKNDPAYLMGKFYGAMEIVDSLQGKVSALELHEAWLAFKIANPLNAAPLIDMVIHAQNVAVAQQLDHKGAA